MPPCHVHEALEIPSDLWSGEGDGVTLISERGLVLTATVRPLTMRSLSRCNPEDRIRDYREALLFWQRVHAFDWIEVVESSETDIGAGLELGEHVRIDTYRGCASATEEKGKGWGEGEIIRRFLSSNDLDATGEIWKVTGRLRVLNIERLLARIGRGSRHVVYANLHSFSTRADSRVFAGPPEFYRHYLSPRTLEVDERVGLEFEHVLARAVHYWMADGHEWRPMPVLPKLAGHIGTSGKQYRPYSVPAQVRGAWHRLAHAAIGRAA